MQHNAQRSRAFTLIELSIVLVIVGLLVGGVLVGRDLILAARLRQVGTELQELATAITTFRIKYNCMPGDCDSATRFFGISSNGCASSLYSSQNGTCNGNGDGFVDAWWMGTHHGQTIESYYGLQQLSLAQLVKGSYVGGGAELVGGRATTWRRRAECRFHPSTTPLGTTRSR